MNTQREPLLSNLESNESSSRLRQLLDRWSRLRRPHVGPFNMCVCHDFGARSLPIIQNQLLLFVRARRWFSPQRRKERKGGAEIRYDDQLTFGISAPALRSLRLRGEAPFRFLRNCSNATQKVREFNLTSELQSSCRSADDQQPPPGLGTSCAARSDTNRPPRSSHPHDHSHAHVR